MHVLTIRPSPTLDNLDPPGTETGQLFDLDRRRLIKTARMLGVSRVYIENKGKHGQHVRLTGKPLIRALAVAVVRRIRWVG